MSQLSGLYRLKEDPVTGKIYDVPTHYLGANIGQYFIPGDTSGKQEHWYMSSDNYVAEAIKNVEAHLAEVHRRLKTTITTPMSPSCKPE
jgi:hypothetical protein